MNVPSPDERTCRLIGIVAATGGPQALAEILGVLPRDFPVPIVISLTLVPSFVEELAARLNQHARLEVVAVKDETVPAPGKIYVSAGDPYVELVQGRLRFRPSGRDDQAKNVLFRSMAQELGPGAVAVILSGMGSDGAEGMKVVRDAGGFTIAQDKATSVIYGIAGFAVELDAVCESLPIQEIGPRLLSLVAE